jgi:hypothetical protein
MKKLIILIMLAFSMVVFGQEDSREKTNLSVVSADKMNVVYRGLANPISIAVPGNREFTVTGPDVKKREDGKYYISPGSETETVITVTYKLDNGLTVAEKHPFRVLYIKSILGAINGHDGKDCVVRMSKSELKDAIISIKIRDFLYDAKFEVPGFSVYFENGKKFKIEGNRITEEVFKVVNQCEIGTQFTIANIKIKSDIGGETPMPISIQIVEEYTE